MSEQANAQPEEKYSPLVWFDQGLRILKKAEPGGELPIKKTYAMGVNFLRGIQPSSDEISTLRQIISDSFTSTKSKDSEPMLIFSQTVLDYIERSVSESPPHPVLTTIYRHTLYKLTDGKEGAPLPSTASKSPELALQ